MGNPKCAILGRVCHLLVMPTAARRFHQPSLLLENALRKDAKSCSYNRQDHTQSNLSEIARLLVFRRAASWHTAQGVPETCFGHTSRNLFGQTSVPQTFSCAALICDASPLPYQYALTKMYRTGAWCHPPRQALDHHTKHHQTPRATGGHPLLLLQGSYTWPYVG